MSQSFQIFGRICRSLKKPPNLLDLVLKFQEMSLSPTGNMNMKNEYNNKFD